MLDRFATPEIAAIAVRESKEDSIRAIGWKILHEMRDNGDPFAEEIVTEGARHVDVLIRSLVEFGAPRISLLGGLASLLVHWLSPDVLHFLSPPEGDAVAGALLLARREGRAPTEPRRQRKVRRYAD